MWVADIYLLPLEIESVAVGSSLYHFWQGKKHNNCDTLSLIKLLLGWKLASRLSGHLPREIRGYTN